MDKLYKRLITDTSPVDQPLGSYRFALNAITETGDGDRDFISNEKGNTDCGQFPQGYIPIGSVYTNNDSSIVFLAKLDQTRSEIGILNKYCEYSTIINSGCLNFKLNKQIDATYRLRRGCEDTIYFTDGVNPIRYINFAKLNDFYTEDYKAYLNNPVGDFNDEKWDCNKFNIIATYKIPCFEEAEPVTGGNLLSGTYNFGIRYLDADYNPTNWIYTSQLVNIYKQNINTPFDDITGSSQFESDSTGGFVTPTNKAIQLRLSNLDPQYPYYQIAAISATDFNGKVSKVVVSPPILIERTEFLFTGFLDGYIEVPKEELLVKKTDYEFAEHIEQLENRLIIANIKGKQVNWCGFQKYASKIASRYVIEEVSAVNQYVPGNPKNPNTYWMKEGYMGDEVYAFGIVYIFSDGFESPVFHIPGRGLNKYYDFETQSCVTVSDDSNVAWSDDLLSWFRDEAEYINLGSTFPKYRVYDTSVRTGPSSGNTFGAMQYHENQGVFYEKRESCDGQDFWGVDACGIPLTDTPIRHHKFPSRSNEELIKNGVIFEGEMGIYLTVTLIPEQTLPSASTVYFTLSFEYPLGTPQSVTVPITTSDIPVFNLKLYGFVGDFSNFQILSYGGSPSDDIVDDYSNIFNWTVNVGEANQLVNNNTILRPLGIQFANIEYPHPDIVGHYFVRGERDEDNRTVLDKGIFGRMRTATPSTIEFHTFSYFTKNNNDTRNAYVFTPQFLFNKKNLLPDYIKNECKFNFSQQQILGTVIDDPDYKAISGKETDVIVEVRKMFYNGVTKLSGHNYQLSNSIILDAVSKDIYINQSAETYNLSWDNKVQVVKTNNDLPYAGDDILYASLKINRNIYPVLNSIKYYRTHNCMFTLNSSQLVYGGDTFISNFTLSNGVWRKSQKGIGTLIWAIIGLAIVLIATVVSGGTAGAVLTPLVTVITFTTTIALASAGITAAAVAAIIKSYDESQLDQLVSDSEFDAAAGRVPKWNGHVFFSNENLQGIYIENEINLGMRQIEYHECGNFFNNQATSVSSDSLSTTLDYFVDKWTYKYEKDSDKRKRRGIPCPEIYHYNNDYSRINKESLYLPLPSSYECCTECLESHPSRVAYSEQSFQEELVDNYKIFKANNYRDIEGEHGIITDIFRRSNKLYIHTSEALWELPQVFQERITEDIVSFIGTGEFFSVPPRIVIDDDMGTAGTQHKWATVKTRSGVIFVNEIEGKIYNLGERLNDISIQGMKAYFENNLKDFLAYQFASITGNQYPNVNNPAYINGVGIHSVFDTRYNRVIITKRDYLIIESKYSDTLQAGYITWNQEAKVFQTKIGNSTIPVNLDNTTFFENKSFTISYSFDNESWVSWHSYIPNHYLHTQNYMYSFINDSDKVWKHNIDEIYQKYYGVRKPHILEYVSVANPVIDKIWDDLSLQTISKQYVPDSKSFVDKRNITFNKLLAYNSRQTTGILNLVVKETEGNPEDYLFNQVVDRQGEILIDRKERNWNLNDLRDYRIDYDKPIFLQTWDAVKGDYFIDKVIDPSTIDFAKNWEELESLRDKFLIIRLIFDNFEDVQLTTNVTIETPNQSFR